MDHCVREAHRRQVGCDDWYYTPLGWIERGEFRNRDMRDSALAATEQGLTVPQVLPGSREEMEKFVELLRAQGHTRCDLNFGCPFPMVAKRERGAGILRSTEAINEIANVISSIDDIRFSVKMRLGWDHPSQGIEAIKILNGIDLEHITIKARCGIQGYKGEVNKEDFLTLLKQTKHPVLVTGDLNTVEENKEIKS